jgi:hypothetical protein
MDVRLHDGGVDAEPGAILEAERDGGLDDASLRARTVAGVRRQKARWKASCLGTGWASKVVNWRSV